MSVYCSVFEAFGKIISSNLEGDAGRTGKHRWENYLFFFEEIFFFQSTDFLFVCRPDQLVLKL